MPAKVRRKGGRNGWAVELQDLLADSIKDALEGAGMQVLVDRQGLSSSPRTQRASHADVECIHVKVVANEIIELALREAKGKEVPGAPSGARPFHGIGHAAPMLMAMLRQPASGGSRLLFVEALLAPEDVLKSALQLTREEAHDAPADAGEVSKMP